MHKLLIFLVMPPEVTRRYGELVSGLFPGVRVEVVRTREEAETAIVDADILMTFGVMMTDRILANARRLKWVHALGTGVDGIVDQPSLPPNVTVTSTRGIHGVPMTEATISIHIRNSTATFVDMLGSPGMQQMLLIQRRVAHVWVSISGQQVS